MSILFKKEPSGSIGTPKANQTKVFIDSDSDELKIKGNTGLFSLFGAHADTFQRHTLFVSYTDLTSSATWDATGMASGLYVYRLEAASVEDLKQLIVQTRKIVLLR